MTRAAAVAAVVLVVFSARVALAQSQTNQFFYDNLGRLAVVLDTNGTDAAYYDYDAVGNITAIRRQTVGAVNLFVYSPLNAPANSTMTLQGTGFSANPALNTVVFCGTITAQVVSATSTQLKVIAPNNAVNCLITVTTGGVTVTNSMPFTSGLAIVVTPNSVTVPYPSGQQFSATVYGTNDQRVTWFINGWIPSGTNTMYGMITTNGYYTPPMTGAFTIHARSVAVPDPVLDGVASVTVPMPMGPIYSPSVSAQPGLPTILGPIYSPTISAQPGLPTVLGPIYSPTVSAGPNQ
jgi:YD repeat-containing protein